MSAHVCPWWFAYTFDHPLRKLVHPPKRMFGGLFPAGGRAIDVGCGMGYFSIGLAQVGGPEARVTGLDIQQRMLETAARRAQRAGVADRTAFRLVDPDRPDLGGPADLILLFWMLHEAPDEGTLLRAVRSALAPDGRVMIAEPKGHVRAAAFERSLRIAGDHGLRVADRPRVALSHAALLGAE